MDQFNIANNVDGDRNGTPTMITPTPMPLLVFPARRNARSDPPLPKGTHGVPDSKVIASTSPILASKAFLSPKSLALKIYPKVRLEIEAEVGFPPS